MLLICSLPQQQVRKREAELVLLENKLERKKDKKQSINEHHKRAKRELETIEVGDIRVKCSFIYVSGRYVSLLVNNVRVCC